MEALKTSIWPQADLSNGMGELEGLLRLARNGNRQARDDLIRRYIPLVLKTGWQVTGRYLHMGCDEEISVGLLAVNEAISCYRSDGGASLESFIRGVIRRRLIDHHRRGRCRVEIPLSTLASKDEVDECDVVEHRQAFVRDRVDEESQARREEILWYSQRLLEFGIHFASLEHDCPRQKAARTRAISCARIVATQKVLRDHLLQRKELPLKALERQVSVSRKTLERQRRYIIAVTLILIDRYEYLHGYIEDRPITLVENG